MSKVAIIPCPDYSEAAVQKALNTVIENAGGLDWVTPGMKIGIKVNLVTMMKPEQAATTHPMPVKLLCKMLKERGAQVTIGDSPGGPYTGIYLKTVYHATGMDQLEEEGIVLNQDFGTAEVSLPQAKVAKQIHVTRWLLEQDAIINFCKLKTHGMMGMSAAAKNLFGTIPGTMKPEYHFRFNDPHTFADMLIDLDEYWKPRLHIVDAITGMEGNGPTAGTPRHIGALLASEDPYDLDLVCAKLIGLKREDVLTMEQSYQRGLSAFCAEEVEVIGEVDSLIVPDYQILGTRHDLQFGSDSAFGKIKRFLIGKAISSRPQVVPKECIGCKKCFDICPAKAITMTDGKPVIDKEKCIHCFCCQEFCPKGAMKVHRTLIAKIIQRT